MTQDVLGALWFVTLLIGIYGMATGHLCLWRRGDNLPRASRTAPGNPTSTSLVLVTPQLGESPGSGLGRGSR